ncbi:MAG: endopeptidase La, partial [Clostridia bacterium]|nr:endopeptidase La [Clostridia bacterium]
LFVVAQRDSLVEHPGLTDLFTMGTLTVVKQVLHLPDQTIRVLLEVLEDDGFQQAQVYELQRDPELFTDAGQRAMMRAIRSLAPQAARARGEHMPELMQGIEGERNAGVLCDVIASNLITRLEDKQAVLECVDINQRMQLTLERLADEIQIGELEEKIQARVREYMDKANHEYYLREQIRAIQEELNEDEDEEVAELRRRVAASKLPPAAREHVEKELKRLARSTVHAPESAVSQNYIEYMLELPWEVYDASYIDIKKARRVLEADHYGMEEVKRRLIEYLAVRSVASDKLKSPIICLVGPPGVGKTSIAQSIARALDRKFTRLSLGGVHDEAEIRGHRKTYVGAMPGRIISAIRQCKTMNPVFLLDEIDKLSRDMRGDPASAMLEALDPAQNNAFRDHYLEVPFDLSDVLFITTANSLDTIDRALLDRMEVIEVPSYTSEEKLEIAKRHLLPKQREAHNLSKGQLKLSDKAIAALIDGYTRESGVRTLERQIAQLCRRATLHLVECPEDKSVSIKPKDLKEYLGSPRYLRQPVAERREVGVVNGLAWTSVGGEVMPVEALCFPGKGNMKLTGKLGDVMKESAELARSVVRARLSDWGAPADYFEKHDIHIHVPEGAVPKDGPSAGVALSCALMSAVTGLSASGALAMTGEITLHGRVLPIGGVKEKLLAAYRLGITRILLPRENEKDLEKIDAGILEKMDIRLMDRVDDALEAVLERTQQRQAG